MVTRVLLVDDHRLVRAGIRALLQDISGIEVVAEAEDGREAIQMISEQQPDVVLMDIAMESLNGLEATRRISKDYPNVRVLMLSMHLNEEYVIQSLKAGAAGYLLKDAGTAELEIAIEAVANGEIYLSPPVSKQVISDYMRRMGEYHGQDETGGQGLLERLTPRQREILQLIAEGRTTHEIAQILNISVKTAETHRMQLMDRLDIHDIAGLVRFAIRTGLVSLDS